MTAVAVPELSPHPSAAGGARGTALRALANPRSSLCVAALMLSGVVGLDALSDPDLWWHLRVGQWILATHQLASTEFFTYTVAGTPRVPQHWLSSVLFAVVFSHGGLFVLALFMGMVCWSGFVAIALRGRALGAGALAIAIGTVLAAKAAEPVLGVRPQVLTFALLCWTLWLTDAYLRRGGRRIWLLPPLFVVWANLHAGFVAGLGALAVILVAEGARSYGNRGERFAVARTRTLLLATALALVATVVNPVGPRIFTYIWSQGVGEAAKGIAEWQHPNFADPAMWAFGVILVSLVVLLVRRPRVELREVLLAAAGVAVGLWAVRNIAISAALVMPLWMTSASQLGGNVSARIGWRPSFPVTRRGVAVGAAMLAVACAVLASSIGALYANATPAGVAAVYPSCAASVLARSPVPQRVFAVYSSADYLAYRLWPQATVYLYGDSEAESLALFQSYYRIASGVTTSPSATRLLQASGTTAVLFPKGALTAQLDQQPGWTRVVDDHGLLLYVRGAASWAHGADCAR